ncbi:MAG: hypothetical protein ACTTKD_07590 [Peptoanaerobacter stomatis]|uniref:hypothetical protein n=1 Tax=Peptoanaerobacter stomatis TaxID=796937 RepID=UPI003FA12B62
MALDNKNYVLKKIRSIVAEDIETGRILVELRQLTNVQLTGGQDQVEALGADGVKLAIFEKGKTFAITATDGLISTNYLALQTGSEFEEVKNDKGAKVTKTIVTSDGNTITLPYKATGVVGNEIGFIYKEHNGSVGKSYEQSGVQDATHFKYDPVTKNITLPTGVFKPGDKVIVSYYPEFKTAEKLVNKANSYSANARIFVNAYFTDMCTKKDVPLQLEIPTGKISGAIDWSFGDNAATQNVNVEALVNVCSADNELFILHTYDEVNIKA